MKNKFKFAAAFCTASILLFLISPRFLCAAILKEAESSDARVRVRLSVEPERPRLSDTIFVTLEVAADATLEVEMPIFGTSLGNLEILDVSEKTAGTGTETETKTLVLKTVPKQGGPSPIWPLIVRYSDRREELRNQTYEIRLTADELTVVAEVTPETASLDRIATTREVIDLHGQNPFGLVVGAVILAVLAILLFILRRRKRAEIAETTRLTPREIALRRLAELADKRLHESDVKQFFIELTDIVRWYIEQQTQIRAPERTTEEFLHEITQQLRNRALLSPELQERLRLFLESADMVKFAKFQPAPEDMMLGIRRAEEFILALGEKEEGIKE